MKGWKLLFTIIYCHKIRALRPFPFFIFKKEDSQHPVINYAGFEQFWFYTSTHCQKEGKSCVEMILKPPLILLPSTKKPE